MDLTVLDIKRGSRTSLTGFAGNISQDSELYGEDDVVS
jgi:hypothetical protein